MILLQENTWILKKQKLSSFFKTKKVPSLGLFLLNSRSLPYVYFNSLLNSLFYATA